VPSTTSKSHQLPLLDESVSPVVLNASLEISCDFLELKKQYVSGLLDSELWEITREEWNTHHLLSNMKR
ncbi:hypothetical protein ACFVMS_004714, partial [Salmonella enterica]